MKPWQKSTTSGSGPDNDCLEVAEIAGIRIRESDDASVVLSASPKALAALLRRVKSRRDRSPFQAARS